MTDAEYDRIDDDGEGNVLDCAETGGYNWDYGSPTRSEEGRRPEDALRDALRDVNRDLRADGITKFPVKGWVGLLHDSGRYYALIDVEQRWFAYVRVGGDVRTGVWRHNSAVLCAYDRPSS